MKKILIVGGTSGIGEALADIILADGHKVGVIGRASEELIKLDEDVKNEAIIKMVDIRDQDRAIKVAEDLIKELGGLDIFVMNAGVGNDNQELNWEKEETVIDINVSGFVALVDVAFNYFKKQGHGQIIGSSSVVALRGNRISPVYSASKSFDSRYLEVLRQKTHKLNLPIIITDLKLGFVNTNFIKRRIPNFLKISAKRAAYQIYKTIKKEKDKTVYIPKIWRFVGWILQAMPPWLYNKL